MVQYRIEGGVSQYGKYSAARRLKMEYDIGEEGERGSSHNGNHFKVQNSLEEDCNNNGDRSAEI